MAPVHFDVRPGIIPLRPLFLGDIYSAVIATMRGNPAATIGLSFLVALCAVLPMTVLSVLQANTRFSSLDRLARDMPDGDVFVSMISGSTSGLWIQIGTLLATPMVVAFFSWVVSQAVLGRKVTAAQTWAGSKGSIWRVLGGMLLSGLITFALFATAMVGFLALIFGLVAGVGDNGGTVLGVLAMLVFVVGLLFGYGWLRTRLAFIPAVIVLENSRVFAALGRSWRLTSGRGFWRIFGIRLLTYIAVTVVSSMVAGVLAFIPALLMSSGTPTTGFWVVQNVATALVSLLTLALVQPFGAGVDALLYVDERMRREGLDVQLMQAAGASPAVGLDPA